MHQKYTQALILSFHCFGFDQKINKLKALYLLITNDRFTPH